MSAAGPIAPGTALSLVQRIREEVESDLAKLFPEAEPADLYDACRYVLASGGKRVRPALVHLAAGLAGGGSAQDVRTLACAVEVFHNFTLVHDDIMDHAAERRGRPTVHEKWDGGTAILCGDLLLGTAFRLVASVSTPVQPGVVAVFNEAVVRLCEGQALDEAFERSENVTRSAYLDMIDRKTGALLAASLRFGGMAGGAATDAVESLGEIGLELGRTFQMKDDLLDLVGASPRWGKQAGGDLMEGKKSILVIAAREAGGPAAAFFASRPGGVAKDEVERARAVLEESGVLAAVQADIEAGAGRAKNAILGFPESPARAELLAFAERLRTRDH